MARPVGLRGPQRVTRRDSHTRKVRTCLNDSRFTHRFYQCGSPFCYTIKLQTVCSGGLLPDTSFPAKISKRPTLKLCSVVSAYSFYGACYTSRTVVCEVLSEVSGNPVFAAHKIDSIEPSEVISNHEHVLLPPDRVHTFFTTNIKKNMATGLNCSCSRCRRDGLSASLGYGAPLALPQRANEIDISLLCRLAQKSLMNMTERTVKVVDVNIHVRIGGVAGRPGSSEVTS